MAWLGAAWQGMEWIHCQLSVEEGNRTMKSRRTFTKEFKHRAINRLNSGESAAEVARALEVHPSDLHRWRRELQQQGERAFNGAGNKRAEKTKLTELERKVFPSEAVDLNGAAATNSLRVLFPYKRQGVWAFDDPSVGLIQEPFVLGVPEMIEHFVRGMCGAENGFALFFSDTLFPRYQAQLEWMRQDCGGNWYRETATGMEGWLCPALFNYFEVAPKRLYLAMAAKSDSE
jgi:transposase-like protein